MTKPADTPPVDWDRHAILAEVKGQGRTMAALARKHGISQGLFYICLDRP